MVNMGIYGIIRVDLQLLGPGPRWWGLTLMIVGAVSALYGVLQASVATDLKRLLAYSTTENMGIVALGSRGRDAAVSQPKRRRSPRIAMAAALLHLVAHAAFKTLGFLAAGSVLAAHRAARPGSASAGWRAGCRSPRRRSASPRSGRPGCRWEPGSSASGCWCRA